MTERFREMRSPNHEKEIRKITKEFEKTVDEIQRELDSIDVSEVHKKSYTDPKLKKIRTKIKRLEKTIEKEGEEIIQKAAKRGIAASLIALGEAGNFEQAYREMSINRVNQNLIATEFEDLYNDLLEVTQNMDKRSKQAVRRAASKAARDNMEKGITGRRAISADTAKEIRKELQKATRRGIVDNAGRKWKPEVYADMVTRTKAMETDIEATMNEAMSREAYYGVISSHGAEDPCIFHEGRIVKLTADAPGNYPTYDELRASQHIFHPNCRHTVSPIRDPELLPDHIKQKARRQGELGSKAIGTGKRHPEVDGIKAKR